MAYLETQIFCSAHEYNRGISERILEEDLSLGALYSMAMRLDSSKREASKWAVRLVERNKSLVRVSLLDVNLKPTMDTSAVIENGLLHDVSVYIRDTGDNQKYQVSEAYMRDYFDDQFGGMLTTHQLLSV